MREAMKGVPEMPLTPPDGIVKYFIDPNTGTLTSLDNQTGIWEFFNTKHPPSLYTQEEMEIIEPELPFATQYRNEDKRPVETLF